MKHRGAHLISTTELSARFGITIPARVLMELGFEPTAESGTGYFWNEAEFPVMAQMLAVRFLERAANHQMERIKPQEAA